MRRKLFTEEQQLLLRQNPYIYSVTETRITLTKEFKEIFMTAYKAGESPRKILEDHGFDISIIGNAAYGAFPSISAPNIRNTENSMRDMVHEVLQQLIQFSLILTPQSLRLTKSGSSGMK